MRVVQLVVNVDLDKAEKELAITVTRDEIENMMQTIVNEILKESPGSEKWLAAKFFYFDSVKAVPEHKNLVAGDGNEKSKTNL